MLLNVSDVLTTEEKVFQVAVPLELSEFICYGEKFIVVEKELVKFSMINIAMDKAQVEGTTEIKVNIPCNRCLVDVLFPIKLYFTREISPVLDEKEILDNDDVGVMEGYHLNVETLIYNEILMSWPMKVLCDENCKGICKQCGANHNQGRCECDDFVPDPRMAAIKDIFDANKEV